MPTLIAFRAVQGLGAGAVLPISVTIAGDIYSIPERAKVQGYLASVWAVSSMVGPTLGGVFSAAGLWRGIFLINVPLCLLAGWMLFRTLHESIKPSQHRVDYLGAALLVVSLTMLILGALEGGQAWAWNSPISIAMFVAGALFPTMFLLVEKRTADPLLPSWVVSRRILSTTALVSFGVGAVMLGLTSFVPTFLDGTLSTSPVIAGLALAALTVGWPISASQAGRLYLKIGFKTTALVGMSVAVMGLVALTLTAATPNVALVAAGCFVVGLGLGLVATPTLIAAQSSVQWNERGVVTGTNLFARSIGSALGVAVFGAIANSIYAGLPSGTTNVDATVSASGAVFLAVLIGGTLTVFAIIAMPTTTLDTTKKTSARARSAQ